MAEIYIPEKVSRDLHDQRDGMQALAKEGVQFHTRSLPEAEPSRAYPPVVMRGLYASIVVGALLGGLFGYLLQDNILAVSGWEALYSMGPFTFVAFWALIGIALGVLLGGIAAILFAPLPVGEG